MSRQPFSLSDDQAAALLIALRPIAERHTSNARSNRLFVRDFIRAVHGVTGRTYSPAIYRRLLSAYAPERRPSTTTLSLEKEFVEQELATSVPRHAYADHVVASAATPASPHPATAAELAALIKNAVDDALARRPGAGSVHWQGEHQMAQAHIADLTARLAASERALSEARATASRLAADLQLAQEMASRYQQQLAEAEQSAKAHDEAHLQALKDVAAAMDEIRKFAMRSIDDIRGETRAERDRRVHVEQLLKRNERMTEVFRQMAYQRGGSIPPELRIETK